MKNNILIILTLVYSVVFTSCQTEIEFSGKETAPLMVLNSIITPDSTIKVWITESKFFLEDDSKFNDVSNAIVKIWVNDIEKPAVMYMSNGLYESSYIPKAGDKIRITAKNNKLPEVNSYTEIQKTSPITSIDTIYKITEKYPITNGYGGGTNDTIGYIYNVQLDLKVYFKDPKDVENYYFIKAKTLDYLANGIIVLNYQYFNSNDPVFRNTTEEGIIGDINGSYVTDFIFSDALFNGKEYGLKLNTSFYSNTMNSDPSQQDSDNKIVKRELVIELQSISKSYYLYHKTKEASNSNDMGFFSEPVQIYNNIEGGIGIFANYNSTFYKMEIRKDIGNQY